MSKVGKMATVIVLVAGAILVAIAYWTGRDSTDAQEALVIPFLIFWTLLAVAGVWTLDRVVAWVRRYFAEPP
jgi:uncharacterized membrane protein YphA (DoxX/SURF4 family)